MGYLLNFCLLGILEKKPFFLRVVFNYRTIAINYQISSSLEEKEGEKVNIIDFSLLQVALKILSVKKKIRDTTITFFTQAVHNKFRVFVTDQKDIIDLFSREIYMLKYLG